MFEMTFRPHYADTDAMGVMYHGNYWHWLEKARVEWLRAIGMPYKDLESQGLYLPLKSCQIEYIKSLFFDDLVKVHLKMKEMRRADFEIEYELFRENELCSRAHTRHVLVAKKISVEGAVTWAPRRIPEEWRNLWRVQNEKKSMT